MKPMSRAQTDHNEVEHTNLSCAWNVDHLKLQRMFGKVVFPPKKRLTWLTAVVQLLGELLFAC